MARYIDADTLMKELEREVELADDWKTAHEIANVVKYAPTVDIAPIKHGMWIDKGTYCVCSLCLHTEPPQYDGIQPIPNFTPYCSMCGAKMDEKENE